MNQKDYCYCGQDLPCPRHGCGVDHQPKPEVKCPKQGTLTPCSKDCPASPASTEVKCGCVPLHKEMQNGVEVYSQTTCFRHSKEYREPIEDVEQPTPASTEDWEKEFDRLWPHLAIFNELGQGDATQKVKDFIRSHDQQLRQRIVEEAEKIIQKERFAGAPAALNKLITFITNLK